MIERTLVFVDTSYLLASFYNSWETGARGQLEIDLREVVSVLDRMISQQLNQPVQRQLWYDGIPESGPHRYQRSLRTTDGVQLRAGQLIEWGDRRTQKAVDTRLVADMVVAGLRGQVSDIVLVSGDADMLPGVTEASAAGCRVHLYGLGWDSVAAALRHACDTITILDPREDFADAMQLNVLEGPIPPVVRSAKPMGDTEPQEDLGATKVPDTRVTPPGAGATDSEGAASTETGSQERASGSSRSETATSAAGAAGESGEAGKAGAAQQAAQQPAQQATSAPAPTGSEALPQHDLESQLADEPWRADHGDVEKSRIHADCYRLDNAGATPTAKADSPKLNEVEHAAKMGAREMSAQAEYRAEVERTAVENSFTAADAASHANVVNTSEAAEAAASGATAPSAGTSAPADTAPSADAVGNATNTANATNAAGSTAPSGAPGSGEAAGSAADSSASEAAAVSEKPTPRPNPSMMAPRRKLRSRYVPLPNEVWASAGFQTPFDVGQQYANWWYENVATEDARDSAHLLSGGGLPPDIDRPLLQFACETLHEYTLTETQRVNLRDGFHAGIRGVLLARKNQAES